MNVEFLYPYRYVFMRPHYIGRPQQFRLALNNLRLKQTISYDTTFNLCL